MGSLQTKIQIWNMALDLLREQPLSSVSDTTATARWLTRNYDQQRDYLTELFPWRHALARSEIAADATAPDWGWSYRYLLPTDALRILQPTLDGSWSGTLIPYEIEGLYLMCDVAGPLRLRHINRVTNEGYFSNGFCEVLSQRLALHMAHWLTGKQSMMSELRDLYTATFAEAKQNEAVQVTADTYYDTDILYQRGEFSG